MPLVLSKNVFLYFQLKYRLETKFFHVSTYLTAHKSLSSATQLCLHFVFNVENPFFNERLSITQEITRKKIALHFYIIFISLTLIDVQ